MTASVRTLLRLADEYDRESRGFWVGQKECWAMRDTASLLRRMVCNRDAADPTRITVGLSMLIDVPMRWCSQHGYRSVTSMRGYTIQRGDEPVIVVRVGDTLRWDGERLAVEAGRP
jgi:hypothetical protein